MNIAVIFAGGVGSRMHSKDLPKQFLSIHGIPIIIRTLSLFSEHPLIDSIVVVCVEGWIDYCKDLIAKHGVTKVASVISGGSSSQESIYKGLEEAERIAEANRAIVLIHDGVRPLINSNVISNNISSVEQFGSAITCVPAKETIVSSSDNDFVEAIPERSSIRIARAPQSFWLDEIIEAHRRARSDGNLCFVDCASLMQHYGHKLHLVFGPEENIKITTPDDFFSLRAILDAVENKQLYGLE